MKFDTEICKGVSCPECSFNKGEDGCLLAKRLDEIEITPEPCEDAVPRTSVEYICRKNTVSTNPYEHKYHDKFIQFMDDPEISDFGRWQYSNGFNTALVAVKCDLDKVPSAQPDVPDTNVGDMISRRTVLRCLIDISYNQCKTQGEADVIDTAKTLVSVMPSAQPEIIRCRNCKFASGNSRICMKFGHSPIGELDFCAWAERRTDEQTKD